MRRRMGNREALMSNGLAEITLWKNYIASVGILQLLEADVRKPPMAIYQRTRVTLQAIHPNLVTVAFC